MARHSIAIALFIASAVCAHAQTSWKNASFNPRPEKEDVLIPMPCGGSMAFRKIVTGRPPSAPSGALSDTQVTLGTERSDARGYIEYRRTDYVSGSFADTSGDIYYLLAKYELTNLQWDAVMTDGCKLNTGPEASMPKTNVSWFEAVDFTRRYTDWLYKKALDRMPKSAGGPSYVRLPTEAEWEFAARGGQALATAERGGDLFPLQGAPLSNFAWFSAPGADGEPQAIGLKRPNPLQLHDMLGNAEEIVLEPFRMNKLGRLHGQIGGFITRGGSVMTEEQDLTLASRQEYPFYSSDDKGEVRRPTVSFRVLVGSTATGDFNRSRVLEQAFEATRSEGQQAQPPATQKIEDLARRSQDAAVRRQLTEVNGQLKVETARRAEADVRTVKTMMMSAILLVNELTQSARSVRMYDGEVELEPDKAKAADFKRKADSHVAFMKPFAQAYTDVIKQLGEDLSPHIESAKQSLRSELKARGQDVALGPTLNTVIGHAEAYRDGRIRDTRVLIGMVTGDGRWLR